MKALFFLVFLFSCLVYLYFFFYNLCYLLMLIMVYWYIYLLVLIPCCFFFCFFFFFWLFFSLCQLFKSNFSIQTRFLFFSLQCFLFSCLHFFFVDIAVIHLLILSLLFQPFFFNVYVKIDQISCKIRLRFLDETRIGCRISVTVKS